MVKWRQSHKIYTVCNSQQAFTVRKLFNVYVVKCLFFLCHGIEFDEVLSHRKPSGRDAHRRGQLQMTAPRARPAKRARPHKTGKTPVKRARPRKEGKTCTRYGIDNHSFSD